MFLVCYQEGFYEYFSTFETLEEAIKEYKELKEENQGEVIICLNLTKILNNHFLNQ